MSPCQWAWGWAAPQVLEVGREHTSTAPLSRPPALALPQSQPLSSDPVSHFRLSRHCSSTPTAIVAAPDTSPELPSRPSLCIPSPSRVSQALQSLSLPLPPQPLSLPVSHLPDPWVSLRFPPLRQRQAGVGPGLGPSPEAAPLPFLYNLIKKRSRFCF